MKKHNVLVITYWSFKDALVQTYTLPYVKMIREALPKGSKIYITTFEQSRYKMSASEIAEAKKKLMTEYAVKLLLLKYFAFGPVAVFRLIFVLLKFWFLVVFKNIKTIHCFAPSAGVLGVILKSFTGKRLVMDSFEPHAEAMVENGTWRKNSFAYRFQYKMERKMARKAFALIATTEGMRHYIKTKFSTDPIRFFVKPAGVDLKLFNPHRFDKETIREKLFPNAKIIGIYSGKIGGIYLEEEVFLFLSEAYKKWKDAFGFIMLTPSKEKDVYHYCQKYNIPQKIIKVLFVSHEEVPYYLAAADFAINPVKPVPSKRYCTSIKDGEYWAMGLPVIIPAHISDDSDIIRSNNIGYVWEKLYKEQYVKSIEWIEKHCKNSGTYFQQKIIDIAKNTRDFENFKVIYKNLYSLKENNK